MNSKKSITITMRLKEKWITDLKKIARRKAYKEDKDVTYQSLIKKAVYEKYIQD